MNGFETRLRQHLRLQMGAGTGVTSFLAVTYFIKQRFNGISLVIAILTGFAAVSTGAQLQIKKQLNCTVILIGVIYRDKQGTNNVWDLFCFIFLMLIILFTNIVVSMNIQNTQNKQIHHLMSKFIILMALLSLLLLVIQQTVLFLQVFKVIVKSQTFFMFAVQCRIVLLFIFNRMANVIDVLIKMSVFTLIRKLTNSQISRNAFSYRLNGSESQTISTTTNRQNGINNTDGIGRLPANSAATSTHNVFKQHRMVILVVIIMLMNKYVIQK